MPSWQEMEAYRREQHWAREAQRRGGFDPRTAGSRREHRSITERSADEGEQFDEDLFFYPFVFGSIAAAGNAVANVTIQSDSKFEWMRTTYTGNKNGAAEPWSVNDIVPITLMIVDNGSGRQLMTAATPVTLLAGKGILPFLNPASRIFQPAASVQMTATNYGGSTYDNITVCFVGRKLFKGRPQQGG